MVNDFKSEIDFEWNSEMLQAALRKCERDCSGCDVGAGWRECAYIYLTRMAQAHERLEAQNAFLQERNAELVAQLDPQMSLSVLDA